MSRQSIEPLRDQAAANTSERQSSLTFHGPSLNGDVDTLMAATVLERHVTVVTPDQDFTHAPGLRDAAPAVAQVHQVILSPFTAFMIVVLLHAL